jgi:hypothetical protein
VFQRQKGSQVFFSASLPPNSRCNFHRRPKDWF